MFVSEKDWMQLRLIGKAFILGGIKYIREDGEFKAVDIKNQSIGINKEIVRRSISYASRITPKGQSKDDYISEALYSLAKRRKAWNGKGTMNQYLYFFMVNDLKEYVRERIRSSEYREDRLEEEWYNIDKEYTGRRRAEHNELIDWTDKEAGFPLGTMLSQGYKGYEIAEKVGISTGRVSQIRKELYAKYKTQNL